MAYVKVYKYKQQVSYDQGETWEDTGEYAPSGDPIGYYDTLEECMAQYRTIQSGYTCVGYDKHNQDVYEVSYDNGVTWSVVSTSAGTLIEADSPDCGYVPPTPSYKWLATYTGGTTSSAQCDSTSAITEGEINIVNLAEIQIGNCVTTIGASVFYDLPWLTGVTIGSGITSIGNYAFFNCTNLQSITINAVTPPTVGIRAFILTTCPIYVPCASVDAYKTAWSDYASRIQCIEPVFEGKYVLTLQDSSTASAECDSTSAITSGEVATQYSGTVVSGVIGDCVTEIGKCAFYNCTRLSSVTIPDSVTTIGQEAFGMTNLTSVTIPDSVTNIDNYIFDNCHVLKSAIIGSGITVISNYTFSVCTSLSSVTIPNSVTTIGMWAFNNCSGMTSITIPNSVTNINLCAFYKCSSLSDFTIYATTPPTLGNMVFESTPIANGTGYIYVPSGSVNAYKSASGWSTYSSRIQAIP